MAVCWVRWFGGLVVWGFGGLAVWWFDGLVVWWFGGLMVWWFGGLVAWWFDGLMVWWFGCDCLARSTPGGVGGFGNWKLDVETFEFYV